MQRHLTLDVLSTDTIGEITSWLDFLETLDLRRTSRFFAENIKVKPYQYQEIVDYLIYLMRLLSKSGEICMEASISVAHCLHKIEDRYLFESHYLDQNDIDAEILRVRESDYRKRKPQKILKECQTSKAFIFSTSGTCYLFKYGRWQHPPMKYQLTEDEKLFLGKAIDSTGKLDATILGNVDLSKLAGIIKRAYQEDVNFQPDLNYYLSQMRKLVTSCAALFTMAMLVEDGKYGLKNTAYPDTLWISYTSWKAEGAEYSKENKEWNSYRFLMFLSQRISQGKIPFSIDLIKPKLLSSWQTDLSSFDNLQLLLDFYKITKVEDFLKPESQINNTLS